ncbi:Six-hairpin glycosidase-like protein [Phlyctochytrium arcticum]|nr:Six-hairpin glycosidase-like protein [Phlyctochytrium arcticum]
MLNSKLAWAAAAILGCHASFVSAQTNGTAVGCNSPIYCPGPLLDTVQKAKLFNDSKTFVDMPTTKPLADVLSAFQALGANPTKAAVQAFVSANFGPEGSEIEPITPNDWKAVVPFEKDIKDLQLQEWGTKVHGYWRNLTRQFKTNTTSCDGCVSSLLPSTHSFVVPGGRFREYYYWDSFFVLEGLLLSEMFQTSHDMIDNLMDAVDQYGFVPNGARIYYLNRSQPPFLTQMVDIYYQATKNASALTRWLPLLDKEYQFWQTQRSISVAGQDGKTYQLNRFAVTNDQPRPESYMEDLETVEGANLTGTAAADLYADLATAAETGWDFSSRWERDPLSNGDAAANLRRLITRQIIPVDLNALLYSNEVALQNLHAVGGNRDKSDTYKKSATSRKLALWEVFWDDKIGTWGDFNLTSKARSVVDSPVSYWPLWSGAALDDPRGKAGAPDKCKYLTSPFANLDELLSKYPGGLPTTLYKTGLQWDLPNSWPPLAYIAMRAQQQSLVAQKAANCPAAQQTSLTTSLKNTAQQYITAALCAWRSTGGTLANLPPLANPTNDDGNMFEKFNSLGFGTAGSGGEYVVQDGFGWTNGVALWTLKQFGADLKVQSCKAGETTTPNPGSIPSSAYSSRAALPLWIKLIRLAF